MSTSEMIVTIKDGDYEKCFVGAKDFQKVTNYLKVLTECGFEVTVKLMAVEE